MAHLEVHLKTGKYVKADTAKMQNDPDEVTSDFIANWRSFALGDGVVAISFPILPDGYIALSPESIDYIIAKD